MALVGALPTLSWVEAFTTTHLTAAADRFAATADLWEGAFTPLASDMVRPGGTEWTGDGALAAQDNADKTAVTARGASNQLRDAAGIATLGADQLDGLHQKTVAAIADARGDGFQVNEDLSVTDTRRHPWGSNAYMARQAEAEDHAESVHSYAGQLLALDNQFATKLDTATAGLETLTLDAPGGDTPPVNDHNGIQLVSSGTFKQSPFPEPGAPDDPVGHRAGRSAIDIQEATRGLPEGTKPNIKLVQTEQQLRDLYKWATENGRAVPNAYGPNSGTAYVLPDGTRIGMRESAGSTKLPALDVKYPGEGWEKVHINPRAGGIPEIPAAPRPADGAGPGRGAAPGAVPPAVVEPQAQPKVPPVRGGPLGGLPVGGVVPDGSMPRLVDPSGPDAGGPDLPVIGDGEPDGPQT